MENMPPEKQDNKKVILASIVTFLLTSFMFIGFQLLNPTYELSFDKNDVNYANIQKFNEVRAILKNKYYEELTENKLLEGAIAGMAEATEDPYTVYYTKEQMQAFDEKSKGSYGGIGISIKPDTNGILSVIDTFEGSPAREKGMMGGDKIVKVDDTDVTTIKDEAIIINMIKGPENTTVKVTVFRPADEQYHEFVLDRKIIKIENIKSELLQGQIGYIKLIMFDKDIAQDFDKKIKELSQKGMKGLIIDVRDNPGGNYMEVVKICDVLLPKALIVYTQNREGKKVEEFSNESHYDLPIAVLMNENSASASEILAGALKDNKRATLLGVKSYGKGLVQTIHPFSDDSGIKFTVSRYFTPSGVSIDKIGILPDIEVKPLEKYKDKPVSMIPKGEDLQLLKAEEHVLSQISNKG